MKFIVIAMLPTPIVFGLFDSLEEADDWIAHENDIWPGIDLLSLPIQSPNPIGEQELLRNHEYSAV